MPGIVATPDAISLYIIYAAIFVSLLQIVSFIWRKMRTESLPPMLSPLWHLLFFSIVFAAFYYQLGFQNLVYVVELSAGVVLGLFHPIAASSFFLVHLFLRPWELLPGGPLVDALPRLLALFACLSWGMYRWKRRDITLVWNASCSLFALFVIWLIISSFFSQTPQDSFTLLSERFFPIVVLFLLLLNSVEDLTDVDALRETLVLSIAGLIVFACYLTITHEQWGDPEHRLIATGLWANSNDLAALITLALPLAIFGMLLAAKATVQRSLALLAIAVLLAGLWLSQSRGALLALMVAGGAYVLLCSRKIGKTTIIGVLALTIPLIFGLLISRGAEDLATSTDSRLNYVITGLKMTKDHPLFGVGMGNYPNLYDSYTTIFHEWGRRTAHSSWVLVLSETGVPGFLLFAGLYLIVMFRAWKIRIEHPEAFVALISYGIAITFLSHSYLLSPYILLVFALAATGVIKTTASRQGSGAALMVLYLLLSPGISTAQELTLTAARGTNKPLGSFSPERKSVLDLRGSRGEVLSFFLQSASNSESEHCEKIQLSEVKSESQSASDVSFRLFSMPTIETTKPSFPDAFVGKQYDPLIPLRQGKICAQKNSPRWYFGEIEIPPTLPADEYYATLKLESTSLPVRLTVWQMTIPEQPALPLYSELTTWYALKGHFGKWADMEAELAHSYVSAMKAHRIYPLKNSIIVPPVIHKDGNAFLDLNAPDRRQSFRSVVLSNAPSWGYFDFPTIKAADMLKPASIDYFKALENTVQKEGLQGRAMLYLWDEPQPEEFQALMQLAQLAKNYAPSVKLMVTVPAYRRLQKYIDIFVPIMDYYGGERDTPSFEAYAELQAEGKEIWWYVSCMSHGCSNEENPGVPDFVLDRPPVYIRAIPWIADKYGIKNFLYYSVVNGYRLYPELDPWKSLWDFSGNGDGTLFYPGRPDVPGVSRHMPIASLRLKAWREASYDAEYIRWVHELDSRPSWWEKAQELVRSPTDWDRNYSEYEQLRDKIGEYLNSKFRAKNAGTAE